MSWNTAGSKRDVVSPPWNSEKRNRLTNFKYKTMAEGGAGRKCRRCQSHPNRETSLVRTVRDPRDFTLHCIHEGRHELTHVQCGL